MKLIVPTHREKDVGTSEKMRGQINFLIIIIITYESYGRYQKMEMPENVR